MSDIHSLFVLISTISYVVPAYEAVKRKSLPLVVLFSALMLMSFVVHCESTGLCHPLPESRLARVEKLSQSLSFFLMGTMLSVVFEVKSVYLPVVVNAIWCLTLFALPEANIRNSIITFCLNAAVFIYDTVSHRRKLTNLYWKRLGVLFLLGFIGAVFFFLIEDWAFHGVWHIYTSLTTYLLLVAQRKKQSILIHRQREKDFSTSSSFSQHSSTANKRRGYNNGDMTSISIPSSESASTIPV